jgi:hypothetical protein
LPPLDSFYNDVVSSFSTGAKYSAGYIYGPAGYNVGNTLYTYGPSPIGVLLSKFDTNDNVVWTQTALSANVSSFNGVAVSSDGGSVYAAGFIRGSTSNDFGNGVNATGPNTEDNVLLVKYDASTGLAQWARTIVSGSGRCIFTSLDVDPNDGSVYVVGYIYGVLPYDFGNGVTVQSGYVDMGSAGSSALIVKYNGTTGLAQWARAAGGAGSIFSQYTDVSVLSDDGSVFVAGTFYSAYNPFGTDTHTFGSGVSFSVRHVDASVFGMVSYDASGLPQFAKTHLTPDGYSYASGFNAIVVGLDGYVYAGGFIQFNSYRFPNGISFSSGSSSGFPAAAFVKFDVAGNAIWAFAVTGGNAPNSAVKGLSFGVDGSIYGVGSVFTLTTFYFGSVTITTGGGGINTYILKFKTDGAVEWGYATSVAYSDAGFTRTAISSTGSVYCSGYVMGPNGSPQYNFNSNSTAIDQGTYSGQNRVLVRYYVDPGTVIPVNFTRPTTELIFRYADTGYYGVATSNTTTYTAGFVYKGPANVIPMGLLVKYDSSDNKQWIRAVTSDVFSVFNAVASNVDGSEIYAAGFMRGNTTNTFGTITLVGPNTQDNPVLVKYNASTGDVIWAKTIVSGAGRILYQSVSVSNTTGDIYACGFLSGLGVYDFGNGALVQGGYGAFGASSNSILIVKYNSSGFAQWARTASMGFGAYSYFYGMTVGSDGNAYASGRFYPYTLDKVHNLGNGVTVQPDYDSSCVLVKYSPAGLPLWARQSKTQYNFGFPCSFAAVTSSPDGYLYAAGFFGYTSGYPMNFGPIALYGNNNQNALLLKYDTAGNPIWANGALGSGIGGYCEFLAVTVSPVDGSIFASGRVAGAGYYDFGNGIYIHGLNGNYNAFYMQYASNGTPVWGRSYISGGVYSIAYGVSLDYFNAQLYVAGFVQGLGFDFGTNITDIGIYPGTTNRFLVRYPSS